MNFSNTREMNALDSPHMCGFVGFRGAVVGEADATALVRRMAEAIATRGPDSHGEWVDVAAGFAVGHRRLSVLDLSPAGHQPMHSASERWVLAYNGEVYNHLELREALPDVAWRGHSDTETLLAAFEAWGVEATLRKCVGMFAIALWDRRSRALWLARDRFGEKPLYYGVSNGTFFFGSELSALRVHPAFTAGIDRGALALFLRSNYVPAPYTIYEGIRKLPAGTSLCLREGQLEATPVVYWSLGEVAERGAARPFVGSAEEALEALEAHLSVAVRGQMLADVPLGALLSGGIDSSVVTALMQVHSRRPVRTFTIGFEEQQFDEAPHARAVAAHLGTEHTELRLTGTDALALVPELPRMYSEPFADSSQLPTHMVMKIARQHVTVALSGDGGDEIFGGYNRYFLAPKVWRSVGWMPRLARRGLGFALASISKEHFDRLGGRLHPRARIALLGDKMHKIGRRLREVESIDDLYLSLTREWTNAERVVRGGVRRNTLLDDRSRWPRLGDPVARMMALDGLTYLPDDILVKVDRAAMAVSLETRAPFLDHRVAEFAWSLPMHLKIHEGQGKWPLRRLLERHVPLSLFERPKMGFGISLDSWLRGPLRGWAESLLDESRLRREGYFEPEVIRMVWKEHVEGRTSAGFRLWSVLMFQAWLEATS